MIKTTTVTAALPTVVEGGLDAPVIYFDAAPVFGVGPGIGRVTLEAFVQEVDASGNTVTHRRVIAHLRGNGQAFESLRHAINGMEAMSQPQVDPAKAN